MSNNGVGGFILFMALLAVPIIGWLIAIGVLGAMITIPLENKWYANKGMAVPKNSTFGLVSSIVVVSIIAGLCYIVIKAMAPH